jgi:hypothetical protein
MTMEPATGGTNEDESKNPSVAETLDDDGEEVGDGALDLRHPEDQEAMVDEWRSSAWVRDSTRRRARRGVDAHVHEDEHVELWVGEGVLEGAQLR